MRRQVQIQMQMETQIYLQIQGKVLNTTNTITNLRIGLNYNKYIYKFNDRFKKYKFEDRFERVITIQLEGDGQIVM